LGRRVDMAWFFRAVETDHGGWECRHGNHAYDEHPTLDEAVEHLRSLAQAQGQAFEVFVHFHDGWVRRERSQSA
jgi:hypothetical protein